MGSVPEKGSISESRAAESRRSQNRGPNPVSFVTPFLLTPFFFPLLAFLENSSDESENGCND